MKKISESTRWLNRIKKDIFSKHECPEFDQLVAYNQCQISSGSKSQIEKHLLYCKLCDSVIESFSSISELDILDENVNTINKRIEDYISKEPLETKNKFALSNKEQTKNKFIYKFPLIRYFAAAAVILIVLFGITEKLKPRYYKFASLDSQEKEMLMLSSNNSRGASYNGYEYSPGAAQLLKVEQKKIGIITFFDQSTINQAINHLHNTYNLSNEAFYRNKYAYFLGKAYLMNADIINAKEWFIAVKNSTESSAYQDAANKILKGLK